MRFWCERVESGTVPDDVGMDGHFVEVLLPDEELPDADFVPCPAPRCGGRVVVRRRKG